MFSRGGRDPNPNKDVIVEGPPGDSVSDLEFSPNIGNDGYFLAAGAWDGSVSLWQINGHNGKNRGRKRVNHGAPVLSISWTGDGSGIFSAGLDGKVLLWSYANGGSKKQVAQHEGAVRHCVWVHGPRVLMTGGWDKEKPAMRLNLSDRVYAMDCVHPTAVVACADARNVAFDLRQPKKRNLPHPSPLKYQTRSLAVFPDGRGYAVGSVEGRVYIRSLTGNDADDKRLSFTFRCHRSNKQRMVFAVNVIKFNLKHGTFGTGGSDGVYCFWKKETKQRLKIYKRCLNPISAGCFSTDGRLWSYASSYDWSQGHEYYKKEDELIFLHQMKEKDVRDTGKSQW